MSNPLTMKAWSPYAVGLAIGLLSWFALASADRLIGITTSFEHAAALAENAIPSANLANPYDRAKAAEGKPPKIGWEAALVVGVFLGAWLSSWLSKDRHHPPIPNLWSWRFGDSRALRYVAAFFSGALMMIGARLAQGCTSGHGISGGLQLAVSSWVFVVVIFSVGIATAFLLYGKEGARHV